MFQSYLNHKILKTVQVIPFIQHGHQQWNLLHTVEPSI